MKQLCAGIHVIIWLSLFYSTFGYSADTAVQLVLNQSVNLYNEQKYEEALHALDQIQDKKQENPNWYYYYALNLARLDKHEEALKYFEIYINRVKVTDSARAYYYTGLLQFYQGSYDKATNSLQLSLDVSNDSKLDTLTDKLIDKVVRYQNYFENSKKNKINFLLGYGYDSNVADLAQDNFTESLAGHNLDYGVSYSYKWIDKYSFLVEPSVAIIDGYTVNNSFKATSTIQSGDALQFLVTFPIRFYNEDVTEPNQFDFSLNAYSIYLPLTGTTRELSTSSFYFQSQISTPLNSKNSLYNSLLLASDKGYGHSSDDDNASGFRIEYLGTWINTLDADKSKSIFYDFGYNQITADGINERYKKYIAGLGYGFASFWNSLSSIKLNYFYLSYPERSTPRTDNQLGLTYSASKTLSQKSSIRFNIASLNNSSNTSVNKYSDVSLGVQYMYNLSF